MPNQTARIDPFVHRHAEAPVRLALTDTRIVAIVGPRQSGKTTLARRIADDDSRTFVTLDDNQSRRFAREDPVGFVRGLQRAVIDEIQRVPDLILALKRVVDEDPSPGRFLMTGSVDLFKGMISPDSLAGRVETIELLPFSQGEIAGAEPSGFLDRAFCRRLSRHRRYGKNGRSPGPGCDGRLSPGPHPDCAGTAPCLATRLCARPCRTRCHRHRSDRKTR